MQEIEAKRKLKASEGAHFFYSLIFLAASGLIEKEYLLTQKCNQNLPLLVHLVFYGLIIWGTYILITIVPRYKNPAIKIFFNFLDICFGIYLLSVLSYALTMYYNPDNNCKDQAPILYYFSQLFIYVNVSIFLILTLSLLAFFLRRFSKANQALVENEEEQYVDAQ